MPPLAIVVIYCPEEDIATPVYLAVVLDTVHVPNPPYPVENDKFLFVPVNEGTDTTYCPHADIQTLIHE